MADARHTLYNPGFVLSTAFAGTSFAVDAATDQVEWVFAADEAATITRLGFRYGARTGTPVQHKISLQGVSNTTGNPDGTIKGGGTPASGLFTPPADATWDGTWRWVTLDNAYVCTRGEELAIVIAPVGTPDGSNTSSFTITDNLSLYTGVEGLPYSIQNNATVRTKGLTRPVFGYASAGTVYGNPVKAAFAPAAITSASTPDEYATRFLLPSSWGSTYQLLGIRVKLTLTASGTIVVNLYNGTTILQTKTVDTDIVASVSSRVYLVTFTEATLATLAYGTEYRVGIQAGGSTTYFGVTQDTNAEWGPYPLGTDWYMSSRTDAGAWTDDLTTRLHCELILRDIVGGGSHFIG